MKCVINVIWDNDAEVYIATSDDIPGLVLESGSFDALIEKVRFAAPELLALNSPKAEVIDLKFVSERLCKVFNV